jgi:hypothetical protein
MVKAKWPIIFGKSGNETDQHCKFTCVVRKGAPMEVQEKYHAALK